MSTLQSHWSPTEVMIGLGTNELEPAHEPAPGMSEEQRAQQGMMAIKRDAGQFFDRQQIEFNAQIEQHRQSVEQQLRADVDPALSTAVSQAHQALLAARREAAQARQALTQHEAARPRVAADVPTWSRQRTDKVGELEAFEAIAADAEQTHRQAQARVQQAMQQSLLKHLGEEQAALERRAAESDRKILAKQAELDQLWVDRERELKSLQERLNFWQRY